MKSETLLLSNQSLWGRVLEVSPWRVRRQTCIQGTQILVVEEQDDSLWRDRTEAPSTDRSTLDCTKQNKVVSIVNTIMRHLRISHTLKCKTMLLILLTHPQGMEKDIRIRPVVVGIKGSPTEGDSNVDQMVSNSMQLSTSECYTITTAAKFWLSH